MTRRLVLAHLGLALVAACSTAAAPTTDVVTAGELCSHRTHGREVWVEDLPLEASSLVAASALAPNLGFSGDSGLACAPEVCCLLVPYFYTVDCGGSTILVAPAERFDGADEIDPDLVRATLECGGNTDGTPFGGARCRPDCTDFPSPSVRDVLAIRGLLDTTLAPYATDQLGRPVFVFSAREVRIRAEPIDAATPPPDTGPDPTCDPTVPRAGCPCMGHQTICPGSLVCGQGSTPDRWTPLPDACGLG